MFTVSACNVRDVPSSSNNAHTKIRDISRKKHQLLRIEECDHDDDNNTVIARQKKVRTRYPEYEAESSSPDSSWFVALVTASNLQEDTLNLPQDCTRSNGLKRKCRKIELTDGGDRLWIMDLKFDKLSDSFHITRGWRNFCDENNKKVGSVFTFKLITKRETPLLSFCPSETTINYTNQANPDRFVTLNLSPDSIKNCRLYLTMRYLSKNGLGEPRMITIIGKNGKRMFANLLRETSGRMLLGKCWREFAIENNMKINEHFTLECIWENATPILIVSDPNSQSVKPRRIRKIPEAREKEYVPTESSNAKEPEEDVNIQENINSPYLVENGRIVILTLAPEDVKTCTLYLPGPFMKANGIDRLGKIIMLGTNEMEWWWGYLLSRNGIVSVGCGWKNFCETNGLKVGKSLTLEFLYKVDTTPVLKIYPSSRK